jgi:hypothetical protein
MDFPFFELTLTASASFSLVPFAAFLDAAGGVFGFDDDKLNKLPG